MSHEKRNPIVTPFEGTSLTHAHFKVIDAFASENLNPRYTLRMLRIYYGATMRKDIIEECEKTWNKIKQGQTIATASSTGYTDADRQLVRLRQNEVLDEKLIQFYFQVNILLNEKGFTEFMGAKPRSEQRPTI